MIDQRRTSSFLTYCLITMIMVSIAGCASAPLYRVHPELSQRRGVIKTVGLLPPVLSMYEYQATWLGYDLVPHADWSPAAADQVTKAFISELAAASSPFVVIGGKEEQDLEEMVELFGPVDFSLQRHAYEQESGEMPPREPFPEKLRFPGYSLGAAQEAMSRKGVDAVWVVRGFNAVPTVGAQVKEGIEVFLAILSAIGRTPVQTSIMIKIELSVALVDKDGTILFYNRINSDKIEADSQGDPELASMGETVSKIGRPVESSYGELDLRNSQVAHRYIRTLLSNFLSGKAP
jgi:hypothetical protein